MSQTGAAGAVPGQISVTLTIGSQAPPTVTHPGVSGPPPDLPTTGAPVLAEIDAGLLTAVIGALIVRLTAGGGRELLGLLRPGRRGAS